MNQEELLRLLSESKDTDTFLLGAGCSVQSGCPSGNQLINEFKKRIYCTDKKEALDVFEPFDDFAQAKLNSYFKNESPKNPYSFYFSKCFPDLDSRIHFVSERFHRAKPSFGYRCFSSYCVSKNIRAIYTTNFDRLLEKSFSQFYPDLTVTKCSEALTPNPASAPSIYLFELHGDYQYDQIRNTESELQELGNDLAKRALNFLTSRLYVIGYAGADNTILSLLTKAFNENNFFSVIWCLLDGEKLPGTLIKLSNQYPERFKTAVIRGFDQLFSDYAKINSLVPFEEPQPSEKSTLEFLPNDHREIFSCETTLHKLVELPTIWCCRFPYYARKSDFAAVPILYCITDGKLYFAGNDQEISKIKEKPWAGEIQQIQLSHELLSSGPIKNLLYQIIAKGNDGLQPAETKPFLYKKDAPQLSPGVCEGISYRLVEISNDFYLSLRFNPFALEEKPSENETRTILAVSSRYRNKDRCSKTASIIETFFGSGPTITFTCGNAKLSFSKTPSTFGEPVPNHDNFPAKASSIFQEPLMKASGEETGPNQISLIRRNGPIKGAHDEEEIAIGVICPSESYPKFSSYLKQLVEGCSRGNSDDLFGIFPGFQALFKKKIRLIWSDSTKYSFRSSQLVKKGCVESANKIKSCCEKMFLDFRIQLAIICFPNSYQELRSNEEGFDFHDYLKLICCNGYKTQIVDEKSVDSADNPNKKIFNLATAIYTKTISIPWKPAEFDEATAFVGIGFGQTKDGPVVACSQMFDGAGQGLQLLLKKASIDEKKNPYLSKDEAYELGVDLLNLYFSLSRPYRLQKVVIHKTTPFKEPEIEGFSRAFASVDNLQLYWIKDHPAFNAFRLRDSFLPDNYPIIRGTVLKTGTNEFALWTDGSIPGLIKQNLTYSQCLRSIPKPISVINFLGKASIDEAATDILKLSKMNINSGDDVFNRLPVTILFASVAADIVKQTKFNDLPMLNKGVDFSYIM